MGMGCRPVLRLRGMDSFPLAVILYPSSTVSKRPSSSKGSIILDSFSWCNPVRRFSPSNVKTVKPSPITVWRTPVSLGVGLLSSDSSKIECDRQASICLEVVITHPVSAPRYILSSQYELSRLG